MCKKVTMARVQFKFETLALALPAGRFCFNRQALIALCNLELFHYINEMRRCQNLIQPFDDMVVT
jgi:hypothetical protein